MARKVSGGIYIQWGSRTGRQPGSGVDVVRRIARQNDCGAVDLPLIVVGAHPYADIGNNTFMSSALSYISSWHSRFSLGRSGAVAGVLVGALFRSGRNWRRRPGLWTCGVEEEGSGSLIHKQVRIEAIRPIVIRGSWLGLAVIRSGRLDGNPAATIAYRFGMGLI
jgi:hypothetical protein